MTTKHHCWAGKRDTIEEAHPDDYYMREDWAETWGPGGDGTCMLEHGHEGPHEFTPDDQITVSFPSLPDGEVVVSIEKPS